MPRAARKKSASDIYHVMVRGVNKQNIFTSDADYVKYLKILCECKQISGVTIYAYCLMPNHVHLLVKSGAEDLDLFMKRIGTRYAVWYNKKYGRVGHLFQDRFKSENVEDDRYFLTVLRYIIRNPVNAGIEDEPGHYKWSSYRAYLEGPGGLTDIELACSIGGGRVGLIHFFLMENDDTALDITDEREPLNEASAERIFYELAGYCSPIDFQKMHGKRQRELIKEAYNRGLSTAQICRLTGKGKSVVYRAIK